VTRGGADAVHAVGVVESERWPVVVVYRSCPCVMYA